MGTVVQMYATGVPADGMAQIDVPSNGNLVGVDWAVFANPSGADASEHVQLSFGSARQATNDSRSVISNIGMLSDLTTSGVSVLQVNKYVGIPDIPVGMGERIYLHASGTAITLTIFCNLHFDFDLDRALARRR